MIQNHFRKFLTNVMTKWNAGQKMALFMVLMSFEISNYLLWMLYIKHSNYAQQFVNIDIINTLFPWALVAVFIILTCAYLFYQLQHKTRFIHLFQLFVMIGYSIGAGYVGYLVGQDNIMSAIAISTAGLLIVLFCERKYSYWIVGLNLICMFTVMYAAKTGLIAPSEFYTGTRDTVFWVYSYFMLCAIKVMIILLLADNMLYVLKQSYKTSKFLSEHDGLTGLPNRLNAQNYLIESISSGKDTSLIMIDLDYFKQVNDNFGHLFGDKVLVEVVQLLQNNLRPGDLLGRYGGEEFVLILPNTNLAIAEQVAKLLHTVFNSLEVEVDSNHWFKPTASFGVVASDFILKHTPTLTKENMLKRLFEVADEAMYFAKDNGRNQVMSASDLPSAFLQKTSQPVLTQENTTNLTIITR